MTVKGPKGTLSHTVAAPITVEKGDDGALEVTRPDDEREPLAARPDPHPHQQHGHRCHRGLREEARDRRRRLPRAVQGPDPARVPARLLPPDHVRRTRRHHLRGREPDQARRVRASTSSWSARSPPTSASCASPSPTRARACATPASTSAARSERLVSNHGCRRSSTASTPPVGCSRGCAVSSVAARRSPARRSVRAWSSPARPGTSSCRSSTTSSARRWRPPPPWRPTCAASTATRPPRPSKVGELVAERAKAAGVEAVVFDRGGNKYHGRVAALADGAREGGLAF